MTDLGEGFIMVLALPFLASLSQLLEKVGRRGGQRTGSEEGGAAHVLGEPARRSSALGPDCAYSWLEPQTTQKETEGLGRSRQSLAQGHSAPH